MKAFSSKLCMCVIFILCVPILLIALFGYLLFVPFDRMPYFKDFGVKYQFFITSRDVVRIYNRIVREQLPVEYVKSNDFEYFVKDGIVLLCGWDHDGFKQVDGEWFLALDDECNTKITVKEALENETDLLKPEHKCLRSF